MAQLRQISYAEALQRGAGKRRHLLLGNGFSIAAKQVFRYDNLMAAAEANARDVAEIFRSLGTTNFEVAIKGLGQARREAEARDDYQSALKFSEQIEALKVHLVSTVAFVHPGSSFAVHQDEFQSCCEFLRPFIGRNVVPHGVVFTTNYDLLLYWTVVRHVAKHSAGHLDFHDGFENEFWNPRWMQNVNLSVVYLHGSLHIFQSGTTTRRLIYDNGLAPKNLLTQIRANLDRGTLPLFISDGTGWEKREKIRQSTYLEAAFKKFRSTCMYSDESLFTVGHSLSEHDSHLMDLVGKGKIGKVFLGAHWGLDSDDGRRAQTLALQWQDQRERGKKYYPLEVFLFDSRECDVWTRKPAEVFA